MIVGYKLIQTSDGAEVQTWGGTWGQSPAVPNPIRLPNGDDVHGAQPGSSFSGYTLTEWHMDPPAPTANDVRTEAQRRIIALVGAQDLTGCLIKQLNANMRANELNDIMHSRELTAEEAAEATALRSLATQIKAIRAASNVLEPNPPTDYADNKYWP